VEVSWYALLTFGALLFLIAGTYLPQLTRFKVAGLELDKAAVERAELPRSVGILPTESHLAK
jgi:hypothetical protein